MNSKLRTDPMIKLFNQSIGRLRLTKTKSLILAPLLVGALVTLLSAPVQAAGPSPLDRGGLPADTFSILLEGPYKPVVHGPDLGLTTVDLSDGSYSTTKIFAVSGLPEEVIRHGNGPNEESDRKLLHAVRWQFSRLRPTRGRDSDGFHGQQCSKCSRRAGWDVHCRNLRTRHTGGDWDLSVFCRWSQYHGGCAASIS